MRFQLYDAFVGHLDGTAAPRLTREDVVSLSGSWPQRLAIDVRLDQEVDETELREVRERLDIQLSQVAEEWAQQSDRDFTSAATSS